MKLRKEVVEILRRIDIRKFSQFTIDWSEEQDLALDRTIDDETDNGSFIYEVDVIREVLKFGPDKDLFDWLAQYCGFAAPKSMIDLHSTSTEHSKGE